MSRLHPRAIPLDDALGCITSVPLSADAAVPPFANTAMDGFAVRSADTAPGVGGEIQITDAIAELIDDGVYGFRFTHGRYDTGNKLDYLKTNVEYALARDDLGPEFRAFLREVLDR